MLDIVVQSALLSAFSNLIAQTISINQDNKPWTSFDLTATVIFALFSALNTPVNVWWQNWLESTFPGKPPPPKQDKNSETPTAVRVQQGSATANVLKKFALDQTVGALFNIIMFIYLLGALKGSTLDAMNKSLAEDTVPIYLAGAKFWPLVSLACFSFVPVQYRILVGSLAGVLWNVYLSLLAQ